MVDKTSFASAARVPVIGWGNLNHCEIFVGISVAGEMIYRLIDYRASLRHSKVRLVANIFRGEIE